MPTYKVTLKDGASEIVDADRFAEDEIWFKFWKGQEEVARFNLGQVVGIQDTASRPTPGIA